MLDKIIPLLKDKLDKIDDNNIGIIYDYPKSQAIPDFKLKYTKLKEECNDDELEGDELYPLRMDIFDILENKLSLVLGDFSAGKTYTAKQIFKLLAKGFIEPEMRYGYFPILVDFPSLAREYKISKRIFNAIAAASNYPLDDLTAIVHTYDTVFIFDGIDDVQGKIQTTLVNEIIKDPYVIYNKCIFTAYVNGIYCEKGKKLKIDDEQLVKFKIEALRDKDLKNIISGFPAEKVKGHFDAIIEMEASQVGYKNLSRNISSLFGIISYYEKNLRLPQNRLELTEYFVDRLLSSKLKLGENELSFIKERLGYKATKRLYSVLNDSFNSQAPCDEPCDLIDNDSIASIEGLLIDDELESALNTSTLQAYLSAYYIFKRINSRDYSIVKRIAGESYSLIQLILEYLLLILDRNNENGDGIVYVLDLLQDTLKPHYDSIMQSVFFFKNNKGQAIEDILNTMLTRGVACITNPPENIIGAFRCAENKVPTYDIESYSANPYEELFYYVVRYDLYDYLPKRKFKNRIERKLVQELQALNSQQETEIIELLDDYTDRFMAFLASEFRVGIPDAINEPPILRGHVSITRKAPEFYNEYFADEFDESIADYAPNIRGNFCTNSPYLTSLYIDVPKIELDDLFRGNCNLKKLKVHDNQNYYSENNCIIAKGSTRLILGCNTSVIPNYITIIEKGAFLNQQQLTEIEIPDSVVSIQKSAFKYCTALKRVDFSKSLYEICENAFAFCTSLEEIHLPRKVSHCDKVFWGLESLEKITVDDQNIKFRVEKGCLIEKHTNKIIATTIDAQIPDSVCEINSYAFAFNDNMTELLIPETITTIRDNAFLRCTGLKSLTIPKTVSILNNRCFLGCSSIKHAIVYAKLRVIHYSLFEKCRELEEIELNCSIDIAAARMFYGCMNLKHIDLPDDTLVIKNEFVKDCRSLKEIKLPDRLQEISANVFNNTCLVELTVPSGISKIESGTFVNCSYLTEINFLGQLSHVEKGAFKHCRSLKKFSCKNSDYIMYADGCMLCSTDPSVYLGFPNSRIPSLMDRINACAFESRMELQEITLGSNVKYIADEAFANCFELRKVVITNALYLGDGSFDGCVNLEEIKLNKSITTIRSNAFRNCKALKTIEIPQKVFNIDLSCFSGCDSLEEIKFSAKLRRLPSEIFSGLKSLKKVIFTYDIETWCDGIFKDSTALEEFTFSDYTNDIGESCFEGCTSLREVKLSNNMEILPPCTFKDCTSLKRLTIPVSITKIYNAFENCTALDELIYLGTKRQWEEITLDASCSEIFEALPTNIVMCSDGKAILR